MCYFCFLLNMFPKIAKPRTVRHPTHPHPLTEVIGTDGRDFICDGCKIPGFGKRYRCGTCDHDRHGYCATCPPALTSFFLHPQHTLALSVRKPPATRDNERVCDICDGSVEGIFYRCQPCDFDVHPLCSLMAKHVQGPNVKFLDKAPIVEGTSLMEKLSKWRFAIKTKVEEMKLMINMISIWLPLLAIGICTAQFIKQIIIVGNFEMFSTGIFSIFAILMMIFVAVYRKILVPFLRRTTGNERGVSIVKRIGIGMIFFIIAIVAVLVEKRRLEDRNLNLETVEI